ncbi:MAG TPA: PIN domain-containing protein [Bacteroidota bacterium]|nr:PIN domain-containing protein [Bacteroidota bacterium]
MIRATIDLNIIIDFLNMRQDHQQAARILDLCARREIEGLVCAHEITTLSYFLLKEQRASAKVKKVLSEIMEILTIIPVDADVLRESLASPIRDYEDAVVEVSSKNHQADFIITRNLSDYKKSRIPAVSPIEFLEQFSQLQRL